MATVHLNSVLHSVSGHFGELVLRRYRGKTIAQRKPVFTQPWSAAQHKTRNTFAGGSAFAARVAADPVLHAYYAERGARRKLNFRQMAIRDYFSVPKITDVDCSRYTRDQGGCVRIAAHESVDVVRVTIALHDATGALLTATDTQRGDRFWEATIPPPPPGTPLPLSITVAAYDRPENKTERTFRLAAL